MLGIKFNLFHGVFVGVIIFTYSENFYCQKPSIEKLKLQGEEFVLPTPETLHFFITHLNDSVWRAHLIPLGFTEIPVEHRMVAFQFEKGTVGKLFQIVSFDSFYGIVSVFWQDSENKISMIAPIKKKIKMSPIIQSVYSTYELKIGETKYWFGLRSEVKNGILEEEATLEFAR